MTERIEVPAKYRAIVLQLAAGDMPLKRQMKYLSDAERWACLQYAADLLKSMIPEEELRPRDTSLTPVGVELPEITERK